jgi:hypothetical protein
MAAREQFSKGVEESERAAAESSNNSRRRKIREAEPTPDESASRKCRS